MVVAIKDFFGSGDQSRVNPSLSTRLICSYAVFTRETFTRGKWHFTIENVTQYNRNVNLPQVNVSRVNTAIGISVNHQNVRGKGWGLKDP